MFEPISGTIGAVGLLFPIYESCDKRYTGYKLTKAFGADFGIVQFRLQCQYSRLNETSRRRVIDLQNPIDENDPLHDDTMQTINRALSVIRKELFIAHDLMKKYHRKGKSWGPNLSSCMSG